MAQRDPSTQVYLTWVWIVLFLGLVGAGVVWSWDRLMPFFLTRAWLNGLIVGILVFGLSICLRDLIRLSSLAGQIEWLKRQIRPDITEQAVSKAVDKLGRGVVAYRCNAVLGLLKGNRTHADTGAAVLADVDAELEESRGAFTRYLIGVMVFLGLIGTFWGLLLTVSGVKNVLEVLQPERVEDAVAFVTHLKASIGDLLGGMSTAFSTSLFGLAGSVILGFVDVQLRQASSRVMSNLDRFVAAELLPGLSAGTPEAVRERPAAEVLYPSNDEIYRSAYQEALADNLRHLGEVIAQQSSTDERVTDALIEIRGLLESLHEEQRHTREAIQSANQTRHNLVETSADLGKQLERLVKESRLMRESSDHAGKAVVEQLKLEGEISNRTLSRGFSDLTRVMLGAKSSISDEQDPSDSGEERE